MVEPTCHQFEKWRHANKPVKVIQQDNAGEKKRPQTRSDQAA